MSLPRSAVDLHARIQRGIFACFENVKIILCTNPCGFEIPWLNEYIHVVGDFGYMLMTFVNSLKPDQAQHDRLDKTVGLV